MSHAAAALLPTSRMVGFDLDRLSAYLASVGLPVDRDRPLRQFAGGLANRNYLLWIGGRRVVLRRPPDGELPPGAHDMAREHRILRRLSRAASFVPDSFHHCADPSVIGVPFQLIDYREGLVIRGSDLSGLKDLPDAPAQLSEMLVRTLASLHAIDAEAVGLGDLGRPEGFVARAISGWTRRGLLAAGADSLAGRIREIGEWLTRQRLGDQPTVLLHCDFKLDNLILDPDTLQPRALVDWDMGTRGTPLFDLATLLSYWSEPGDPACLIALDQMPTSKPGFWTRAQAAHHYAALTGFDLAQLPAARVLCMLKLGTVLLQLHRQWVTGAVTDPRYATFAKIGEGILALTHDMILGLWHDD